MFSGFGASISADGEMLLVGAPNSNPGVAYVFHQTGPTEWEEKRLVPSEPTLQFGNSVLLKNNTAIVAALHDGENMEGAVFFFDYDVASDAWEQNLNKTLRNEDCDGEFGSSMAYTSDDGLLVGCPGEDDAKGRSFCIVCFLHG